MLCFSLHHDHRKQTNSADETDEKSKEDKMRERREEKRREEKRREEKRKEEKRREEKRRGKSYRKGGAFNKRNIILAGNLQALLCTNLSILHQIRFVAN